MPRKAKSKADAVDYGNRTDLQTPGPPQAVSAAPNQAYGEAGAQRTAQQNMPLPNELAAEQSLQDQALASAQAAPPPGAPLNAPTARPNEPIQAGLSSGPGPGPEVFQKWGSRTSDLMQRYAELTDDPTARQMAELFRIRGR